MILRPVGSAILLLAFGGPAVAGGGQPRAATASAKWNQPALESALAYAQRQRSSAVVVVDHGKVLAERYWKVEAAAGSPYANRCQGTPRFPQLGDTQFPAPCLAVVSRDSELR